MNKVPIALLAASSLLTACQPSGDVAEDPSSTVIASQAAGIRLATLPDAFEVERNDDEGLFLAAPSELAPGKVAITLGGEFPGGFNIFDEVSRELANFEAMPEGESFGQTQLVAPIGTVYMARGRYDEAGVRTEQLRAMVGHPWGNRLLTLAYTYPVGDDTTERGQQLMELLGEVEALEQPVDPAAE